MNPPSVSVIIPARGPAPGLEACLQALGGQTLGPLEVIVVDNGVEGGVDRIREALPRARVVLAEREGSYAARNAGLREASGTVMAFTDADCVPAPGWLEEALRALAQGVDMVAGEVEVTAAPREIRSPAEVLELTLAFPQETYVRKQGFGVTANLVVRRRVFSIAGLFRENLLSGGDFEWGRRARAAGFSLAFHPGALVRHPARIEARELEEKERRVTRGICQLVRMGDYGAGQFLRMALWTLSPPLGSTWTLLRDTELGPLGLRVRAAGLLCRLRWIRLRTLMDCSEEGRVRAVGEGEPS